MSEKIVCRNKKARHDYFILDTLEAGIILQGTEVKSLREGKANLKDSFAKVKKDEVFLYNLHISPYSHGNVYNHDPTRTRKLLLHKREIKRLIGKAEEKGLTLIPLDIHFSNGLAKVSLALARGKKVYDKREDLKKKDADREVERAFKNRK